MATIVYILSGKLSPAVDLFVTRKSTGLPYDFTGHTAVTFSMRKTNSSTSIVKGKTALIISPATAGHLRYQWVAGDTDDPGIYKGHFAAIDALGSPVGIPNDELMVEVRVIQALDI